MTILVRPYQPGDEHGICAAHIASIRTLCAKDYPAETVEIWSTLVPHKYVEAMTKNNEHYHVLDDNGTIAGLAAWSDDELQAFYLHPKYAGQGLGRKLYEAVEADYRATTGHAYWELNSTLTSYQFYERMGFTSLRHEDQSFTRGGRTAIMEVVRMRKEFTN